MTMTRFKTKQGTTKLDAAGAVVRSLHDKLSDSVSVKDFGAVGDGVTDDTAAFTLALASGSICVRVPAGVYMVGDFSLQSNTAIVGDGVDVTIIRRHGANFSSNWVSSLGKEDVTISGLTLDGRKSAGFTGTPYDLYFLVCARVRCSNVKVINSSGRGISCDNNTDAASGSFSVFDSVYVDAANESGIVLQESSNVIVDSCGASNNGSYGFLYAAAGGTGYKGDNITVSNGVYINNGKDGICFPLVGTSLTPAARNITVTGNVVSDNNENGITMQCQYGTVSGNTSFRNGTAASFQGILVNGSDLTIVGNTSSDNRGVGIDLGDCYRTVCDGNTVTSNGILGIEVNSCEQTVVSNNMVSNNNTSTDAFPIAAGILVHKGFGGYPFLGNAVNTVVTGNIVTGGPQQQFGILVTVDTVDTVLSSNICKSAGSVDDIRIQSSTYSSNFDVTTTIRPGVTTFISSAATVNLPDVGVLFQITGTSTVNTLNQTGGTFPHGRVIRLRFNNAGITLAHGAGNIYLKSATNVTSASNAQTIDLMCVDGGAWLEVGRNF